MVFHFVREYETLILYRYRVNIISDNYMLPIISINIFCFIIGTLLIIKQMIVSSNTLSCTVRLSEKFLSFYEEIIDAQRFFFCIIFSNYVRSILFCWDKHRDISQTWFHVCMTLRTVVKNTFAKERHFPGNIIHFSRNKNTRGFFKKK